MTKWFRNIGKRSAHHHFFIVAEIRKTYTARHVYSQAEQPANFQGPKLSEKKTLGGLVLFVW